MLKEQIEKKIKKNQNQLVLTFKTRDPDRVPKTNIIEFIP